MAENPNNFDNRTRLKKVKRPINRALPQMPENRPNPQNASTPPKPSVDNAQNISSPMQNASEEIVKANPFQQSSIPSAGAKDAFDLDTFLDSTDKLPTASHLPNRNANQHPQFLGSEELNSALDSEENNENYEDEIVQYPLYANKKILFIFGFLLFFIGLVAGKLIFKDERVVRNGLQGVVVNSEVPRGRARCGLAERTQGCVLYLMNPQRQELNAKDFYDLASQLTGRQRFVIETGNMRYANTKIRPGDIAQINIPPL